jgi:hypothetical protein
VSERTYMGYKSRSRPDQPAPDPFAWMALRCLDMGLGEGVTMRYDPELTIAKRVLLSEPPDDVQLGVWTLDAATGEHVEALLYGHPHGHPHLDVYVYLQGELAGAQLICDIKRTFFSGRLGVGLEMQTSHDRLGKRWMRVELSYCPAHDPKARKYLRVGDADHGH